MVQGAWIIYSSLAGMREEYQWVIRFARLLFHVRTLCLTLSEGMVSFEKKA